MRDMMDMMTMSIRVTTERQYAVPGRSAMFAWKPYYTAYLPLPRTDGLFKQTANSKAELKFFVSNHLRHALGFVPKFNLEFN
jgi:hypothetical protein